jgi:hypothetical protein
MDKRNQIYTKIIVQRAKQALNAGEDEFTIQIPYQENDTLFGEIKVAPNLYYQMVEKPRNGWLQYRISTTPLPNIPYLTAKKQPRT